MCWIFVFCKVMDFFLTILVTVNLIKKDPSVPDNMGFYAPHCWHSIVL